LTFIVSRGMPAVSDGETWWRSCLLLFSTYCNELEQSCNSW